MTSPPELSSSDPSVWVTVAGVAGVVALVVSAFSAYWAWRSYVLAPRRDVLRCDVGNLWRISESSIRDGVDPTELLTALNGAKVVFGGKRRS